MSEMEGAALRLQNEALKEENARLKATRAAIYKLYEIKRSGIMRRASRAASRRASASASTLSRSRMMKSELMARCVFASGDFATLFRHWGQ